METYNQYKNRGVVFVGLVCEGEQDKASTQGFIDKFQIPWPNGYGAEEMVHALGVSGFPTLFVIGADGRVVWNDELPGELPDQINKALDAAAK